MSWRIPLITFFLIELQRPQELQDFLRRVEDSIRTSNTTLDRGCCDEDTTLGRSTSPSPPPESTTLPPPQIVEETCVDKVERPETPTFDAGTQTSPMSLSRSSSFLWVSDCNCSGSLDGSVPLASAPTSRHSEAGSSGVSRIVHMDTSMSSLVSESSAVGLGARRRVLRTPDSANDAEEEEEEEEEDDDEGSSVSLSRSLDGGVGGGGAESGIGTGSPPPRDRRRRPIPHDHPEVSVQTTLSQPESDESSDLAVGDDSVSSSSSSTDEEEEPNSVAAAKKREKVRRRETWEKIRRRHSCKRVHSRTRSAKDKPEIVWIRRGQSETPPPPPVPPHAVPVGSAPTTLTTFNDVMTNNQLLEPAPKVLHKPPVVIIQSAPRPKPRPLLFKIPAETASSGLLSLDLKNDCTNADSTVATTSPSSVKMALQSVLAMELSTSTSKSTSTPFLLVGGPRHLKPISASSTPTDPYVTLEVRVRAGGREGGRNSSIWFVICGLRFFDGFAPGCLFCLLRQLPRTHINRFTRGCAFCADETPLDVKRDSTLSFDSICGGTQSSSCGARQVSARQLHHRINND